MRRAGRGRRSWFLIGATAISLLAIYGVALSHTITVKPGRDADDVNPHELPAQAGDPKPDKRGGDFTASGQPPNNCWNAGPVNGAYRGTLGLQRFLDRWFRGESWGIYNCRYMRGSTTSVSIHAEGRALDWHLDATVPKQHRAAKRIRHFFLRRDSEGRRFAMARRFGIQQIIFNNHHWSANQPAEGWHACDCGHRDHMHIEQNWRGAKRRTTAYTGYEVTHTGPHPLRAR
jgi:hypothetical protein